MTQSKKSIHRLEPKRPSPMMAEPSMKEALGGLTPRWLKRLLSRNRSS